MIDGGEGTLNGQVFPIRTFDTGKNGRRKERKIGIYFYSHACMFTSKTKNQPITKEQVFQTLLWIMFCTNKGYS